MKLTFWQVVALLFSLIALGAIAVDANASEYGGVYEAEEVHNYPYCFKDWSNGTECAAYAVTVADWMQTRQIKDKPGHEEKNAFICGKQPSEGCVAVWMLAKIGVIYYINHWQPDSNFKIHGMPIKLVFNTIYTVSHANAVANNLSLGLKLEF